MQKFRAARPLLASSSDVSEIRDVLSRELESVNAWLVENRLSLHFGKTESTLFGSKQVVC